MRGYLLAVTLELLTVATAAHAATFVVNSTDDAVDAAPGDGVCETATGNGVCTLRAAIQEANAHPNADTIELAAATYTLTIPNGAFGEDAAVSGDLDIREPLTIRGAGAPVTIVDGNALDRVFDINAPATLSDLTIRNGHATADGGGIQNFDQLTLRDVTISGNTADGGGGGVSTAFDVTWTNVTVSGNTAVGMGGGISHDSGTLTLSNVTVSGNGASAGGGIENFDSAVLTNVTIADNTGGGFDHQGAFNVPPGTATLRNTLLAGNGTNCTGGAVLSDGHSMETGSSCGFGVAGSNQDPVLGPLADNGGPTFTQALGAGSPAIDAGDDAVCPATDQRGALRPLDGNGDSIAVCDIGAYEFAGTGSASTTTTISSISTTTSAVPTTTNTITTTSTTLIGCGSVPRTGCQSAAAQKARLKLGKGKLSWKWTGSAAVNTADFGNPATNTDYLLCVYDASGLKQRARALADHMCGSSRCWKPLGTQGFKYGDKTGTPDGLTRVLLKAGGTDKAKIRLRGRGVNLVVPTLPLITPVRVQLTRSASGVCWEARYSTVITNTGSKFTAKSD